jgi:hypothetical protein
LLPSEHPNMITIDSGRNQLFAPILCELSQS